MEVKSNLISHNELILEVDEKSSPDEKYDQVSDYFQCISEWNNRSRSSEVL